MKVQLSLWARKLPNVAGTFKGTSDPFAVVTQVSMDTSGQTKVLGKTEVIKNNTSPEWVKVFIFDYKLGTPVKAAVQVYDEVRKGENKSMGSAVFDIGSVLGARGNTQAKKMKGGGTIYARVDKYVGSGTLRLAMKGTKLKNTEGFLRKSDPFFELSRKVDGPSGTFWDNVYRSKPVMDNLNPVWGDAIIDLAALCNGDLSQPIRVTVYDYEKSGKHVLMGEFETTVDSLVAAKGGESFVIKRKGKDKGQIQIVRADITGIESTTAQVANISLSGANPPMAFVPGSGMSGILGTGAAGGGGGGGGGGGAFIIPHSIQATAPTRSRPTFVDFIGGGCQLNLCVAIDFTGSNGDPRRPGTLHYMNPDGSLNDYEKAISSIGTILSKYDYDQKFPVWGFGAKYGGIVQHCFQVGLQSEADGVDGIIEAYRDVFRTGLIMSGPTVFNEIIQTAAARAVGAQEAAQQRGEQAYAILLILTDGAVSDINSTAACINQISDSPLSIVIVGVGNADFGAMRFLDDGQAAGRPDIAQFVQFNAHSHNPQSLTSATLEEIPDQLVGYFSRMGISPLSQQRLTEDEIVVGEEEEIDLSLNFGADGEISVAAGGLHGYN